MKLGVFFIGSPSSGGLYQYSLTLLENLKARGDSILVFNLSGADLPREYRKSFRLSRVFTFLQWLRGCAARLFPKNGQTPVAEKRDTPGNSLSEGKSLFSRLSTRLTRLLVKLNKIDLIIFTAPHLLALDMDKPYVMPVHDLQHRLNPQFPEVSADGLGEKREYFYKNSIERAAAILVDSAAGKEDVLNFYNIGAERVGVLPFVPPTYLRADVTEEDCRRAWDKYKLPPRFLFYPANFWRHKNHRLIIEALNRIKTAHNLTIPVVFVGSQNIPYSVFDELQELIKKYSLQDQVFYPGYISNEDMACLYKIARALVMPTYFGPTNIPYLEAFLLGCPVIGSDIRGVREQVGDVGLLVDPDSPEAMETAILRIWNDAGLREDLIKRGYERAGSWDAAKFAATFNRLIDEVETGLR